MCPFRPHSPVRIFFQSLPHRVTWLTFLFGRILWCHHDTQKCRLIKIMNSDTKAIVFTTLHLLYLSSVSTQCRAKQWLVKMSLLRSKTGSMSCMGGTVLSMNSTFIGSCSKSKDCTSGGSFQSTSGRGRECFGTARGRYWSRGWLETNQLKGCWWWWYFCQLCTVNIGRGKGRVLHVDRWM